MLTELGVSGGAVQGKALNFQQMNIIDSIVDTQAQNGGNRSSKNQAIAQLVAHKASLPV